MCRTKMTLLSGIYAPLRQRTSGKKSRPDGTAVAGQKFEYQFDDIGNRKLTKAGGDASGLNLRSANYTNNLLNQIKGRDFPGSMDILGIAHASSTVTVNGQSAYRKGEYFDQVLTWNTASGAVSGSITNMASLAGTTETNLGVVFLPKTPETNAYDADGNLTQDGRWKHTWDAENRLVRMIPRSGVPSNFGQSLTYTYDSQSRRISKTVSNWTGSAWALASSVRFVYDGWNLLAVLDSTNALLQSFTWGLDASGSMQGAGGVGALLSMTVHTGTNAGSYFYAYDGNYNVTALLNATNSTVAARYEYGPFGESIRDTGPMASANPIRFSTKFQDDETDLIYYLFRYYNPQTGRWPNRDPIGEVGGENLYGFVVCGVKLESGQVRYL